MPQHRGDSYRKQPRQNEESPEHSLGKRTQQPAVEQLRERQAGGSARNRARMAGRTLEFLRMLPADGDQACALALILELRGQSVAHHAGAQQLVTPLPGLAVHAGDELVPSFDDGIGGLG